jgi:uncharacterized protein
MSNMKIFDFNVHLPSYSTNEVNEKVADEGKLFVEGLKESFNLHLPSLQQLNSVNFMLFNTNLFEEDKFFDFSDLVNKHFEKVSYTALIDFRRNDLMQYLENAKKSGIDSIKFHAYAQKISSADFTIIYKAAKFAEENNLIICIDTSYGTTKMYDYDNLKLACFIADVVRKVPIVLLHSGGARVLDALLIADEKSNVYLETSFSLPYYQGSSIEQDLAFVYKKLGSERIIYGSDSPYISSQDSLQTHIGFFEKYNFRSSDIENIVYNNALRIAIAK